MSPASFNRVEIDLAALRDNYLGIRRMVGPQVRIMAVVKSDAYGHGMIAAASALAEAGADIFGVAEVEEGIALRKAGINGEIVVLLGPSPDATDDVVRHKLIPMVFNLEVLAALSASAGRLGGSVGVHLKVDVGMGRLGIMPDQVEAFAAAIEQLPGVFLAGVVSHFPMADDRQSLKTAEHLRLFVDILTRLQRCTPGRRISHIANSAGLMYKTDSRLDLVRPGITLYGCYPDGSEGNGVAEKESLALKPVMSFKTSVLQVKEVPAGSGLSYGHTFITTRPTRIAVLPVGYDDGYLRKLSNRAEVLIHGKRAPVRGRVCMNACMVDITDIEDDYPVQPGDEVVLLGRQQDEEISADEVAGWLETISYEVLCLFGSRNRRAYLGGGSGAID